MQPDNQPLSIYGRVILEEEMKIRDPDSAIDHQRHLVVLERIILILKPLVRAFPVVSKAFLPLPQNSFMKAVRFDIKISWISIVCCLILIFWIIHFVEEPRQTAVLLCYPITGLLNQ